MDSSFVATILWQASSIATSLLHCSVYEMETTQYSHWLFLYVVVHDHSRLSINWKHAYGWYVKVQCLLLIRVASYAIENSLCECSWASLCLANKPTTQNIYSHDSCTHLVAFHVLWLIPCRTSRGIPCLVEFYILWFLTPHVNQDFHRKFLNFTCEYLHVTTCGHTWKSEVIVELYCSLNRQLVFVVILAWLVIIIIINCKLII